MGIGSVKPLMAALSAPLLKLYVHHERSDTAVLIRWRLDDARDVSALAAEYVAAFNRRLVGEAAPLHSDGLALFDARGRRLDPAARVTETLSNGADLMAREEPGSRSPQPAPPLAIPAAVAATAAPSAPPIIGERITALLTLAYTAYARGLWRSAREAFQECLALQPHHLAATAGAAAIALQNSQVRAIASGGCRGQRKGPPACM